MTRRDPRAGLTLLEALIALAIVGSAFGAVLELQGQLVRNIESLKNAHSRTQWRLNAVEISAAISREEERAGHLDFSDDVTVGWRPSPEGPSFVRSNRRSFRLSGPWTVYLAPVRIEVSQRSKRLITSDRYAVSAALSTGETPPR